MKKKKTGIKKMIFSVIADSTPLKNYHTFT